MNFEEMGVPEKVADQAQRVLNVEGLKGAVQAGVVEPQLVHHEGDAWGLELVAGNDDTVIRVEVRLDEGALDRVAPADIVAALFAGMIPLLPESMRLQAMADLQEAGVGQAS